MIYRIMFNYAYGALVAKTKSASVEETCHQ